MSKRTPSWADKCATKCSLSLSLSPYACHAFPQEARTQSLVPTTQSRQNTSMCVYLYAYICMHMYIHMRPPHLKLLDATSPAMKNGPAVLCPCTSMTWATGLGSWDMAKTSEDCLTQRKVVSRTEPFRSILLVCTILIKQVVESGVASPSMCATEISGNQHMFLVVPVQLAP